MTTKTTQTLRLGNVKNLTYRRVPLFVTFSLSLALSPIVAQENNAGVVAMTKTSDSIVLKPAPQAERDADAVTLDELVVSATIVHSYRAESVQVGSFRDMNPLDVPMMISFVTRDVLDAQGVSGLYEALKNTPGVTRSQQTGGTFDNIAIRGIASQNRDNFRLNGSLPVINLIQFPMETVERVEVLKGAASLYYGFITPSGVVNYVSKRPMQKPVNELTFTVNEYGAYGGSIDVSRRVNSQKGYFGVRVNAGGGTEDVGVDHYSGHRGFAAIASDWRLSDKVLFRLDYMRIRKNVSDIATLSIPVVNGVALIPPDVLNTRNLGSNWMKNNALSDNLLFRSDFILSHSWTLNAEVGYARVIRDRSVASFAITNLTTGAGTITMPLATNMKYQNVNGRVQLFGRFTTGPMTHNLSLGITENRRSQDAPTALTLRIAQNYFHPVDIAQPSLAGLSVTHAYNPITDIGEYAYDRVTMMNERIQLIAGVRHTDYTNSSGGAFPLITVYKKSDVSPGYSAVFKPTQNSSIFASYLLGLESGGVAATAQVNAGQILPPLQSSQKELGAKAQILGGVFTQVGFFEIRRPSSFINATNYLVPNGLARSRGVEMSASGEVVPSLSLITSVMFLGDKQINPENPATNGRETENTPSQTFSMFAEWRAPFLKGFSAGFGGSYVGRRAVNNFDQGYVGGYTTYQGSLNYAITLNQVHYTARVTGDNLANKNAWGAVGQANMTATLPRMIKLSLKAAF